MKTALKPVDKIKLGSFYLCNAYLYCRYVNNDVLSMGIWLSQKSLRITQPPIYYANTRVRDNTQTVIAPINVISVISYT